MSKRKVFKIFYSSETGTAKKYAREALDLLNMSFKTEMFPLNEKEATFESLSDSDVAIIIVSTFGNGEAPGMSRDYMKMINTDLELLQASDPTVRKKYEDLGLQKKRYAVFGLGSSAYPKFAAFSKTMDELFETFGASRLLPRGTGDELKDQKGKEDPNAKFNKHRRWRTTTEGQNSTMQLHKARFWYGGVIKI